MYLFNPMLIFLGSDLPYFTEPDSYYYYKMLKDYISIDFMYIITIICLCIGLYYFYKTLEYLKSDYKDILVLLLGVFPTFYMDTYLGYFDTPFVIFMLLAIAIYYFIRAIKEKLYLSLISYCMLVILAGLWSTSGAMMLIIIMLYSLCISKIYTDQVYTMLISGGALALFILTFWDGIRLYIESASLIEELKPTQYILFYVLILIVILVIMELKKYTETDIFLICNFVIFVVMGIMMRRFGFFAVIFAVLILGRIKKRKNKFDLFRALYFVVIFISIMNLIQVYSQERPFMNNLYEMQLKMLDSKEIIGNWGYGHYYSAFTKGNVLYKAHPEINATKIFKEGLANKDYKLIDLLNTTPDYYLILNEHDINDTTEFAGFKFISKSVYNNNFLIVFQRGE
jgi:hypothetical protein